MGDMKRRLSKLEEECQRCASPGSGDPQPGDPQWGMSAHQKDGFVEFWEMEVEWTALHLQRGLEPRFTLDDSEAGDAFVTLDGRFAVSRGRINLPALMGPRTEEIVEAMPPDRWDRFLAADDEAADTLECLFEMVNTCVVPDDYSMSMLGGCYTFEEVNNFKGTMKPTAIFLDDEEREGTRRLTWTLLHNPDARAMLSELTRRRDVFVREECSG